MKLIYVGSVTNTHGLKGEIRILSNFKFKQDAFKISKKLYIRGTELVIRSYRKHKDYDMVTFENLDTIEDVLIYKGEDVYIDRDTLEYEGYLNEDLIGLDVYNGDKLMGKIVDILNNSAHDIFVVENGEKHMIPNVEEFVKEINLEKKCVQVNYIKGLANED